ALPVLRVRRGASGSPATTPVSLQAGQPVHVAHQVGQHRLRAHADAADGGVVDVDRGRVRRDAGGVVVDAPLGVAVGVARAHAGDVEDLLAVLPHGDAAVRVGRAAVPDLHVDPPADRDRGGGLVVGAPLLPVVEVEAHPAAAVGDVEHEERVVLGRGLALELEDVPPPAV